MRVTTTIDRLLLLALVLMAACGGSSDAADSTAADSASPTDPAGAASNPSGIADGGTTVTDGAGADGTATDGAKPPVSHGDEYLWIDTTYTWDDTVVNNPVEKSSPPNWYAPIDYYDGTIEMRLDVTSKADATPVWLELCMWQTYLGDPNHTCLHCFDPPFSAKGVYTCTMKAPGPPVDYHKTFAALAHRVKDGTSGRGIDLATEKKGLPITAHYTIVLVPAKATFSGWAAYGF